MDNDEILNYNATKENFVAQVMMYQGTNLGPGLHSLKIWNEPVGSDQSLAIDFAVVHTARFVMLRWFPDPTNYLYDNFSATPVNQTQTPFPSHNPDNITVGE